MNTDCRLALVVTTACNLACDYCYLGPGPVQEMPDAVALAAIDQALVELSPGGTLHLTLFGGEPLLALGRVRELLALARARASAAGVRVSPRLCSNGVGLTRPVFEALRADGVLLSVSLDGLADDHERHRRFPDGRGSFAAIWANLSAPWFDPTDVAIQIVMTPDTVGGLAAAVAAFIARGFRHLSFTPDHGRTWTHDQRAAAAAAFAKLRPIYLQAINSDIQVYLSYIEEKIRRLLAPAGETGQPCRGALPELVVMPDGRAYPCERLARRAPGGAWDLGPIVVTAPADPIASGLARWRTVRPPPAECASCSYLRACAWRCGCVNLLRTGDPDRPDDQVCFFERLMIDEARHLAAALLPTDVLAAVPGLGRPALPAAETAPGLVGPSTPENPEPRGPARRRPTRGGPQCEPV